MCVLTWFACVCWCICVCMCVCMCICMCVMFHKGRVRTYVNAKDFGSQISVALQPLNGFYFSDHKFCQVPTGKTEELLR